MMATFWELERRPESAQVPKYFLPLATIRPAKLLAGGFVVVEVVEVETGGLVVEVETGGGVVVVEVVVTGGGVVAVPLRHCEYQSLKYVHTKPPSQVFEPV